jgi:hypothetical protein
VATVFRRSEEPEKKELIPRRDLQDGRKEPTLRNNSHLARPAPNAPALIRLVRHPYRLNTVRPTRKTYLEKQEPRAERVDWKQEVHDAKAEWQRPEVASPTKQRPRAFTILPSRWKLLPGERK